MFDVVTDIPAPDQIEVFAGTVADRMSIAVAPSTSRVEPALAAPVTLTAGDILGHITGGYDHADAGVAPVGARLRELLARPGQLVGLGQGLAYMERVAPLGSTT